MSAPGRVALADCARLQAQFVARMSLKRVYARLSTRYGEMRGPAARREPGCRGACHRAALRADPLAHPGYELGTRSQPDRIGRPARVGAALEQPGLLVGDDRADRAGQPGPVRPPFDLVAEAAERRSGRPVDPALQIE